MRGASASTSSSRPAVSRTIPTSRIRRFPGNPTESYRSREPLRIVGEVESWEPHPPERLAEMKAFLARLDAEGGPEIID